MADAPLKVTVHPPAYYDNPANIATNPDISGQSSGTVDADVALGGSNAPEAAPSGPQNNSVDNGMPQVGGTIDADDALGDSKILSKESSNGDILSALGYSDSDISRLQGDPLYKALQTIDGKDFMQKEISKPGSIEASLSKIPTIGAMIHGADQTGFGVMQLMMHTAHKAGLVPETTPALADALAALNEQEFSQTTGIKQDEYTVPKIIGGVLMTGGGKALYSLGKAGVSAVTRAATGAAPALAEAGGAAAAQNAPVTAKTVATRFAKGFAKVGGAGAAGSVAYAPNTDIPREISEDSRSAYWTQKGEAARQGALWALALHGLISTGARTGMYVADRRANAKKIGEIIDSVRQHGPLGSEDYQKVLDQLTPLFKKPEYAERAINFAQHGIQPTLGDLTDSAFIQKTERTARSMPKGLDKFRNEVQQPQVQAAVNRITTEQFDRMINTKWGGRAEIEKAAEGAGRYAEDAKRVLEVMDNAGTDASKILQAGGKAENLRKLLIKEKLFQARDKLAGRARLDPALPRQAATKILDEASHASVPNRGFTTDVGNYANALADPAMPKSYKSFQNDVHNVETLIKKYGADTWEGQQLMDLKRAYQRTLDDFTNNVTKYAKSERFGITSKETEPFFKARKGGGYALDVKAPHGTDPENPNIRLHATIARTPGELSGGVSVDDSGRGNYVVRVNGKSAGRIEGSTLKDNPNVFRIDDSEIREEFRGKGHGTEAYRQVVDSELAKGRVVRSGTFVSNSAARVYQSLKDIGYKVETNPDAVNLKTSVGIRGYDSSTYGASDPAVFTITGGPKNTVKLRSPVIVEGPQGMAEFSKHIGLPDGASEQQITDAAVQYAKASGHDGVVFTKNGVPRSVVDLTEWKRTIGDADARAKKFYKDVYRPAVDSGVTQAMRGAHPDEIFNQFVQKGKENRAQAFFDSLDAKGQASIKYELVKRAVAAGTVDAEGHIDPKKVANYLFKNEAAKGVFFKGEEKWQIDGLLKLMEHSQEAAPGGHGGGGHGVMGGVMGAEILMTLAEAATTGHLGAGIRKAGVTVAGLAGAGAGIRKIVTSPKIQHYLMAASDMKPGSENMQKLYEKFMTTLDDLTQVSVAHTAGGKR